MQTEIHPTAIVDESAVIGSGVRIGPYSIIGPKVVIGDGCEIASHVVLTGPTTLGRNNRIYQFSSVGQDTPDKKYQGEDTTLVVGDNNVIREGVTIHRGTVQDRGETTIGDDNLIMAYAHVGHDSVICNNTILVNNVALAGHVEVRDWAILSGFSLVHQHCTIGEHAFTGMGAAIGKDVPAYVMVAGNPAEAKTINAEGLRRRGFSREDIALINKAYKIVYRRGLTLQEALEALVELREQSPVVQPWIDSLKSSSRGITR
ncbi:acyl-ACP--UDP-N-acetylglucosamine O-acyltransferase [Microbulbifer flavimaris]|uniref:Acyl-[acyl-carrier-protein]--UDP-N-acetylglucosamine O-acyltransferase n=1 Tax=Microbulbifer flavimaris TaxID=1781068 RepID=A0ABX4I1W0_9GAMM|nr:MULTISPECIES: acyl-ACP--UDP-N-acetylglucosamine O-acyltransferase [Microbulbifer]KUJ84328.1 acyl-[acyl-carrier-protein]--UDP-N-acetylglucosamine O-acyltransferase [Microbulbifer sp. ZGT114]PCO06410.1 acyl-ACP--UDP-N-acetylglucosamine O-acyltransferase [Microbulbifer flavimaris]